VEWSAQGRDGEGGEGGNQAGYEAGRLVCKIRKRHKKTGSVLSRQYGGSAVTEHDGRRA
jgi:hypothetical protein